MDDLTRRDLQDPSTYRKLRKATGMSQADAAAVLGVHRNTIGYRERGLRTIDREAGLAMLLIYRVVSAAIEQP